MSNPFKSLLNWISKHFSKDASKMLIWTGVAGWSLSSLAQIFALISNPKISEDQKSFLIPQEIADAVVNIGAFFLITQVTKKAVAKLFSTGKFAPATVRNYLNKYPNKFAKKVGKINFDLDEVLKKDVDFPKDQYYACKNFFTTVATVTAGIVSSNIVTPVIRNNMASNMQKKYLNTQKNNEIKRPLQSKTTFKSSYGMRI